MNRATNMLNEVSLIFITAEYSKTVIACEYDNHVLLLI